MGYYNPVYAYGEEKLVHDAKEAGANGFILVDLPPEQAVTFRGYCKKAGLSYVPLVAPATTDARLKLLGEIADSFIYVVSKMGTTGAAGSVSTGIPELCARVRKYAGSNTPLAVGFGVSTREHYLQVGADAEGVVIGSKIVTLIGESRPGERGATAKKFVESILIGEAT
ncbi:unnamed protein product [[Candida] boidinii]|nr:unnamed protein product [[Candida] boidinii]